MIKKKLLYVILALLIVGLVFIGISIIKPSNEGGTIISGNTVYAATLDEINTNMNSLMSEIETGMRTNPQLAMMGSPIDFIKESQSYKNIVGLGLKAVKPLYDKLYESHDAGLYEYILSLAIEEITQEEFVYNTEYGWKNSLEFRLCYETKVNNVQTNVERIINDESLSDEEKTSKLKEQGVFAMSALISEYNNEDSKVSKEVIIDAVQDIASAYNVSSNISTFSANDNQINNFVNENKDLFDSLVDLNGAAYK